MKKKMYGTIKSVMCIEGIGTAVFVLQAPFLGIFTTPS